MLLEWLEKATFTTADIDPAQTGGVGGRLSPAQAQAFLRMAIEASVLVEAADNFDSNSTKFEIPRVSFNSRILRKGSEAQRLIDADRTKPSTDLVTISTALFKGEIPIGDEVFEDQIEKDSFADTVMTQVGQALGRDIEEILIKSDTTSDTSVFTNLPNGGMVAQLLNNANALKVDTTSATDHKGLFGAMIRMLPAKYRRNYSDLKFYVPLAVQDNYHEVISARGTGLGDSGLINNLRPQLAYQGIEIVPVPMLAGTDTHNSGGTTVDFSKYAFLCDPKMLAVGWHRKVRIEKFRDPREGYMSIIPSLRMDMAWKVPESVVLAYNIPAALR